MTTITKEQVDAAIKELDMAAGIADTFHVRNCFAALDNVKAYIAQLEERVKVLEEFAEWSSHNWDNQDISHADFRVLSAGKSKHALAGGKDGV